MARPGETGGNCPRCDEPTTLIGAGHSVYGVWCDACDLLVPLHHDVYLTSSTYVVTPDDLHEDTSGRGENGDQESDVSEDRRPDR